MSKHASLDLVRAAAMAALLAATACAGGSGYSTHLRQQGEAGQAAMRLMDAHGGLARFLDLRDLEMDMVTERYDATGALTGDVAEVHRLQAGAPRRHLLRRAGQRITEMGLTGAAGWVRLDGVTQANPAVGDLAAEELGLLNILLRAPFCLADPGTRLSLVPGAAGEGDTGPWLVAEFEALPGNLPSRFVFIADADSGRLRRILFEPTSPYSSSPLREARLLATCPAAGVELAAAWEMRPATATGGSLGLADVVLQVGELKTGSGFGDEIYEAGPAAR